MIECEVLNMNIKIMKSTMQKVFARLTVEERVELVQTRMPS